MADRIAVVTGASSGIGLSIAESLLATGFKVIGLARSQEKFSAITERWTSAYPDGAFEFHAMDVTDIASSQRILGEIAAQGVINVLVNAAGVLKFQNTTDVDIASFDEQCNVLFKAPFFCTTAVLPSMLAAGGGVIINIGSVAAEKASPKMAVYAAAKAALENFTKTVALEFAGKNIRAICISPGAVETNLMDKVMFAMIQKKTPLKRLAKPAEIGALVRYLVSDEASYITGVTVTIDGGSGL